MACWEHSWWILHWSYTNHQPLCLWKDVGKVILFEDKVIYMLTSNRHRHRHVATSRLIKNGLGHFSKILQNKATIYIYIYILSWEMTDNFKPFFFSSNRNQDLICWPRNRWMPTPLGVPWWRHHPPGETDSRKSTQPHFVWKTMCSYVRIPQDMFNYLYPGYQKFWGP